METVLLIIWLGVVYQVLSLAIRYGIEKYESHGSRASMVSATESREIEQDAPVGWECTQYSQRLLEEKLVAAGAMKAAEMTTCEDPKCVLCESTRLLISAEAHRDFRESLQRAKNYSAQALSTVSTPNEQRSAYENCANCDGDEILVDNLFDAVTYKHTPCDAHKGSHEELHNRMMSLVAAPNHTVNVDGWLCG